MSIMKLDNITNVAKGLDKEMLDMTYGDKHYRDVIQPAKLGKAPIPSKAQMMYQNLKVGGPFKAMRIGIDPYLPDFMGGGKYAAERAMPTKPAQKFLNLGKKGINIAATLGSGAGIGVGIGQLTDLYLKKTDTPQAYAYRKQLLEEDPYYFDETNPDVGEGLAEIDRLNRIYTPGDSFRSMNDPTVYGTIEDDLMKYSDSELMESDTTTKEGILSKFNPLKALGFLADLYTGGSRTALRKQGALGILENIFKRSGEPRPDYQYRTPGYTGQLIASDLYDPKTRTNRFDRAKTLFGQSRNLMEYIQKKKAERARKAAQQEIARMGYQDYGQGGVEGGNYDTSRIDDAGNYRDELDPGQTE